MLLNQLLLKKGVCDMAGFVWFKDGVSGILNKLRWIWNTNISLIFASKVLRVFFLNVPMSLWFLKQAYIRIARLWMLWILSYVRNRMHTHSSERKRMDFMNGSKWNFLVIMHRPWTSVHITIKHILGMLQQTCAAGYHMWMTAVITKCKILKNSY